MFRDGDPKYFPPDPAQLKKKSDPDPTLIRNENKYLVHQKEVSDLFKNFPEWK